MNSSYTLKQRSYYTSTKNIGFPNVRFNLYNHFSSDYDYLLLMTEMNRDVLEESDEESYNAFDFTPHYNSDSLPSSKLYELSERTSCYDKRVLDVSDCDFDDICTDIEFLEYYYGWTKRNHWKKGREHPYVFSERCFDGYGEFPLLCDYEHAQRENEQIIKLVFKYLSIDKRNYMSKEDFDKWLSKINKLGDDEHLKNEQGFKEPDRRISFDDARAFLQGVAAEDSQLKTLLYSVKSSRNSKRKTNYIDFIAKAASTQGWFRDAHNVGVVHYNYEEDKFDAYIPLFSTIVSRTRSCEGIDFYTGKKNVFKVEETHRYITAEKPLSCVPKMERTMELAFLESPIYKNTRSTWITTTYEHK